MTTATSILRTEHEAIMKMLDAAEETARQLRANQKVEEEKLGRGTHERLHALMESLATEIFGGDKTAGKR